MTNKEKIVVSAYTGVLMCNFSDMHEYIEAKFGRPVFTHEMASEEFQKELKEKTREDFMAICEEPDVPDINDGDKYEYHYDHTDCIWYRPEARNRCPVTCAQYRDGWNDAMNYIFRDGKGYRPYRRNEQYGE